MKTASLAIGILAIIGLLLGFIPCLGAFNWINIPFSILGLILGIVALNRIVPGESKGAATAGIVMCAIAIALGTVRLILGGGLI